MKNPIRNGVIALLVSSALLAAKSAEGQSQPSGGPGGKVVAPAPEGRIGPVVSVHFPGGTLEEYIGALQQAAGDKPMNVVVPASAKKVELPAITLRNVSVFTALSAVRSAFEENSEHRFDVRPVGDPMDLTYAVEYLRVERSAPATRGGQAAATRILEVYSIRDLIEPPASAGGEPQAKVEFESILSAVDAAMGMFDEKDPPKLLFHKETGLLLVSGTPYQTEVVGNLIRRIRDDLQRRWAEERGARKQSAEQQRRVAIARTEVQIAQKELALAEEQLARIKQLAEQGMTPRDELSAAVMDVDRKKAALERKRIELEALMDDGQVDAMMATQYDIGALLKDNPSVITMVEVVVENGGGRVAVSKGSDGRPRSILVEAPAKTQELIRKLLSSVAKPSK